MPVPISSFTVDGHAVYSIALKDRTQRPHRNKTWLYKTQLEAAIYGPRETSNGALNKLLARLSMNNSALLLNAAAVEEGTITEAEFTQIIMHFQTNVLLSDAKGKAKNVSLVPTSVASAASQAYGRIPRTVELLRGLSALPRTWRLEEERDALAALNEEDLLLEEEIEKEEIDETLDVDLATEIVLVTSAYKDTEGDEAVMANYQLNPIPAPLEAQLAGLERFRSQPFNRHRSSGGSVVDITVKADRECCLRFLNFCVQQKQLRPDLKILASPNISELVEAYLNFLRTDLGLKASSLSNYVNSLISVSSYALTLVEEPELVPTEELIHLRRQCEAISKSERLFAHKDPNFIEFTDAQKARVKSYEAFQAAPQPQKLKALREYMIIAFHTLQCPDRVGVVRKMRLNTNLYLKTGESQYTVDLTSMKDSHKTTRFYGPTIHHLNPALSKVVYLWKTQLGLEFLGTDRPYLFAQSSNYSRGVSSQQWTQQVKQAFFKFSGVSPCPKTLRQSFICYLRSDTNVDKELMESAAKAMKHLVSTQGSDHYDVVQHDRLLKKANDYCLSIAAKFDPSISAAASSSASVPLDGPSFTATLAGKQPASTDSTTYVVTIPMEGKTAGQQYSFPMQPPLKASIAFVIPDTTSPSIAVQFKLTKGLPDSFELKGLSLNAPAPPPPVPVQEVVHEEEAEEMEVEAHQPVPSRTLPPKQQTDIDAALVALGYGLSVACGDGDCFPLSAMAGHELTDASQVANPSDPTTELVRKTRVDAVNMVTGSAPIGGIDAKTIRREEHIKVTPVAASRQMSKWKESYHWATSNGRLASFFQFAISLKLQRPVIVIEAKDAKTYYDPARIYGMVIDGSLRKEPAAPGKSESIPSFFLVPISEALETLRANPRSMSVVRYNGTNHFNPWLPPAAVPQQPPPIMPPPAKKQKGDGKKKAVIAAVATPSKEATIEEALSGIFTGFKCVTSPPAWLDTALTDDTSQLIGSHIIFKWHDWGYAAGKISAHSTEQDSNFVVKYAGNWLEHHALLFSTYGPADYGSWMLIERTRSASPLVDFKAGKYLVQRQTGNEWLRASDLLQYSDNELATARSKANANKRRQSQSAAEIEIDASGFAVGEDVYAKGLAPTGEQTLFAAQVIAIRRNFPPIQVRYTADLSGNDDQLFLPIPAIAFVPAINVQRDRPQVAAVGKRARSKDSYKE